MLRNLQSQPAELGVAVAVVGLVMGSFLSTLVIRLPEGWSVVFGRSQCEGCGRRLQAWQLIPVIGWLCQGGRCRFCNQRISPLYLLMELGAVGIGFWALAVVPSFVLVPTLALGWCLFALAVMDWRCLVLSDVLVLPLTALGLVTNWLLSSPTFFDHVVGVVAGVAFLYAVGSVYRRLRHRDGLGFGDAKLFGAAGAWLGWQGLPSVLLYAAMTALLVVLFRRALGTMIDWDTKIAFGSYLCIGTWIVWLYGPIAWG
jgi:leader peptidase (prepilin peptidase)/N-methyltransferase